MASEVYGVKAGRLKGFLGQAGLRPFPAEGRQVCYFRKVHLFGFRNRISIVCWKRPTLRYL
jgi:hypothetical protein